VRESVEIWIWCDCRTERGSSSGSSTRWCDLHGVAAMVWLKLLLHMHEFSVAAGIMESVSEFAVRQRASRVIEVRLTIGEFTHIEQDQLRFCFESITSGTLLDGAKLEIDTSDAAVRCPHCGYAGPPKYWEGALAVALVPTLQCPECGKAAEPAEGHECAIKTVKFARDDDSDFEEPAA